MKRSASIPTGRSRLEGVKVAVQCDCMVCARYPRPDEVFAVYRDPDGNCARLCDTCGSHPGWTWDHPVQHAIRANFWQLPQVIR